MTKTLIKRWVKALRSGRYMQGAGALHYKSSEGNTLNCCLGVLCRIERVSSRSIEYGSFREFDKDREFLTRKLLTRFGLSRDQAMELAIQNDHYTSFSNIADWIEKHIKGRK